MVQITTRPWSIPPEKSETYERNQSAWEEEFGSDFELAEAHTYAIGASRDGLRVGFEFHRKDGPVVRASLPAAFVEREFFCSLMLALERCAIRQAPIEGVKPS